MFDLEGQCDNCPVDAHFIQEGLLKLIQDSKKKVRSFYNLRATAWRELDVEHALNHPISPNEAAKFQFLCDDHEKFFWPVENPGPNWDDPEHRAKLVYRACLMNRYIREWFVTFCSNFPFLSNVLKSEQRQLTGVIPLETATRKCLTGIDAGQLLHAVARIPGKPIIAASGILFHPLPGTAMHVGWVGKMVPMSSSPIAVTVLPARKEQLVMFSYTAAGMLDAKFLLDSLEYCNGSIGTARLSKKLLEEMELIHISPKAWASLGRPKREFITQYWYDSWNTTASEIDTSPSYLNLFATSSLPN